MPISDDFDMDWILENSYGFVGADNMSLTREVCNEGSRRYLPEIDLDQDEIPLKYLRRWRFR